MAAAMRGLLLSVLCGWLLVGWGVADPIPPVPEFKLDHPYSTIPINVAAFNVEIFGIAKMDKPDVVASLVELFLRHDMCLLQEIRDKSETAIYEFMEHLNRASAEDPYSIVLSERLGRTSAKEQYAYIYKESKMEIVDSYQWPDVEDHFERPPFVVRIRTKSNMMREFGYIGIHVKPSDAVSEIDHLTDVYDAMAKKWNLEDFVIAGDFNNGCRYVTASKREYIRLHTDSRFQWLIGDNVDTTIASSSCAYDRIVITGSLLKTAYVHGSALAYRYDDEWALSYEEAKMISDHVPVEMDLW